MLGRSAFLPVHWGTFSLAMHAWDEPAETLLSLGTRRNAQLVMPRLGEPVEPSHVERVQPWWRTVDRVETKPREPEPSETTTPKGMAWPID
jgi:hypothetical protein